MVAGHLQEKYGIFYIVLSYKDSNGKRKVKWESTGLPVKKNKKKAEALLLERRRTFVPPQEQAEVKLNDQILFSDFLVKWLEIAKNSVQLTTYASYQTMIQNVIAPYFRKKGIRLVDLKAVDLQEFYTKQLERVCANSVIHYHAAIHKALKYAVKIDLIPANPADKVERPKKNEFRGNFYSAEEINLLLEAVRGTKLEIPVLMGAFYGLRPIRFHDLRHSCASLLLSNGVPMKQIQEWLGHSDFSTTANIYAHLDYSSKLSSAQAMAASLSLGDVS